MKKLFIALVIIVLAYFGYNFYKGSSSVNTTPKADDTSVNVPLTTNTPTKSIVAETKTDAKLLERLGNVGVAVSEDGSKVNLLKGTATFSTPETNAKSTVSLGTTATTKDFGNRKDIIAVINLSSGGILSQYLVLFEDTGSAINQTSIAYLGQGLDVRGVVATDLPGSGMDYVVSVTALTQKPNTGATFIIPVKAGAFDTAKAISL